MSIQLTLFPADLPYPMNSYRDTNQKVYKKMCQYCAKCVSDNIEGVCRCVSGVPYYAVSMHCRWFSEQPLETPAELNSKQVRALLKQTLVSTV